MLINRLRSKLTYKQTYRNLSSSFTMDPKLEITYKHGGTFLLKTDWLHNKELVYKERTI